MCYPDGLRFWPQIPLRFYVDNLRDILHRYTFIIAISFSEMHFLCLAYIHYLFTLSNTFSKLMKNK